MSDLSAKALTEDAEGCSRLRAAIASDPGYLARAEEARSGRAVPFARTSGPELGEAPSCPLVKSAKVAEGRGRTALVLSPFAALASAVVALASGTLSLWALTFRLPSL
jgi:hypothetical protein